MVETEEYPNCCGATVLCCFQDDVEQELDCFRGILNGYAGRDIILKFILTETQARAYPELLEEAAERGFVISASWRNGNTGNNLIEFQRVEGAQNQTINQIARAIGWRGGVVNPDASNTTDDPPIAAAAAAEPARVVSVTYHNRYRNGRYGAGFFTLDEAIAAAPRCNTRVRREVYSDGRVNSVEV